MKRNGFVGSNVAQLCRHREMQDCGTRTFQQKLHVTENMVRRLGMEVALEAHTGCVNCLEWNERGSILASASDDVQVILWDPFRRKKLYSLHSGHHGNVFTVKFLPKSSDRVLITGAGDCQIRVHDISVGEPTLSCSCHVSRVKRIATAPSVPYMFWSASEDGTILQFDLRTSHFCSDSVNNLLINLLNHFGNEAEAKCVAINPVRDELLAVGANDQYIRLYDRRMIKPTDRKDFPFPAARFPPLDTSDNLTHSCVDYFVAGHLPLTRTGADGKKNHRNIVSTYLTFGPNGRDLLVNMGGEQVYIFDIINKRKPKTFDASFFMESQIRTANDDDILPNNEKFGMNGYSTEVNEIYNKKNILFGPNATQKGFRPPARVERLKLTANKAYEIERYHEAICVYNEAISLCPNYAILYGNRAAAYMKRGWEGDIYAALRDCYTALKLDPVYLKAHFRLARCLLELHCADDAIKCMSAFEKKFPGHANTAACKALLQDIKYFKESYPGEQEASDEDDLPVSSFFTLTSQLEKYWRQNAYDYESRFCGHCNTTTDIKEANFFGSDGQFIVAGSDDGSFFIWDRKTTNILKVLRGDDSIVNCLQPHPTYCLLATSGIDPVVRLWTPRPEDGTRNEREVLNLYDAASANQKRMNADPFEVMLINMGYRIQAMRGEASDSNFEESDTPTINCRPS